jgi:hypothetical protein
VYRNATLSSSHYAYTWRVAAEGALNDREQVNKLAIDYSNLPDGPDKEAKCLELVQCFHGYLMKYLNMIVRGHLPSLKTPAGKDASRMLSTLVPAGTTITREALMQTCKTLHLAFKQNTADDIYDTLVMCMMRGIRKYDPHYTVKVKQVCDAINAKFRKKRGGDGVFTESEITDTVGLDSRSYLRMLVRRGHLVSVAGPKKKVVGYKRTAKWPPPSALFESGPVGFVYFLPKYFQYYLHEYISDEMRAIESKEGMLQLDHRGEVFDSPNGPHPGDVRDIGIPHAEGNFVDRDGNRWAADTTLLNLSLDVSRMDEAWVESTTDKLFRKLTRTERYLLYLVYVKEYKWLEIAALLDCDTQTAHKQFDQIMIYLKDKAKNKEHHG